MVPPWAAGRTAATDKILGGHQPSSVAQANRSENCLHQMSTLRMSVGSVARREADVEAAVGRLELRRPPARRRRVRFGRQVDVQVRPVPDAEVLEPDRPLAWRGLDQRAVPRPKWKSSVPWNSPNGGLRGPRLGVGSGPAWLAAADGPRTGERRRRGGRRRCRGRGSRGGDRRLDELGPDPDRRHAGTRRPARTPRAPRPQRSPLATVPARDRRPVVPACEEEHADDHHGAQRHREVAVVVQEGEQAAAKVAEDRHAGHRGERR